jgi:2-polyprenyl-3-methyl-5-hydroxy-6-metoxy-1,4-benzoquinol methylase
MNSSDHQKPEDTPRQTLSYLAGRTHDHIIYQRRIRAIANAISPLIPSGKILDVGCGNGELAAYLMSKRSDIEVIGLEVILRPNASIPTVAYGGGCFPFAHQAYSSVLIADTLHHIEAKEQVLEECLRVSRGSVIIKDHFYRNFWEHFLLRGLDIAGNAPYGVPSIFNYFTRESWQRTLKELNVEETYRIEEVPGQYPMPFQVLIGRNIQFIAKIARVGNE